jgi:hypothetical protein
MQLDVDLDGRTPKQVGTGRSDVIPRNLPALRERRGKPQRVRPLVHQAPHHRRLRGRAGGASEQREQTTAEDTNRLPDPACQPASDLPARAAGKRRTPPGVSAGLQAEVGACVHELGRERQGDAGC